MGALNRLRPERYLRFLPPGDQVIRGDPIIPGLGVSGGRGVVAPV